MINKNYDENLAKFQIGEFYEISIDRRILGSINYDSTSRGVELELKGRFLLIGIECVYEGLIRFYILDSLGRKVMVPFSLPPINWFTKI